MVIGDDVTVGREDDARPGAALAREQAGGTGALVAAAVAGGNDLHHGGLHARGEGFERLAEVAQGGGVVADGLADKREGGGEREPESDGSAHI